MLPNDLANLVIKFIIFSYNYNKFIKYCNNKNISNIIWGEKGLLDFDNFNNMIGTSNKAKYLRCSSRSEFNIMHRTEENRIVIEAKYRHDAKLLDYDGKYDNRFSLKLVVDYDKVINMKKYPLYYFNLPQTGDSVLIFLYSSLQRDPHYVLRSSNNEYKAYHYYWERNIFFNSLGANYKEVLRTYDSIVKN